MRSKEHMMAKTLFGLDDSLYRTVRSYNALRLAGPLLKAKGEEVRMFLNVLVF